MGERGDADVMLVHAPSSEKKVVDEGVGLDRRLVMHNDFVLLGPSSDPAGVKGTTNGDGRPDQDLQQGQRLHQPRRRLRHRQAGEGALEEGEPGPQGQVLV